MSPGYDWLEQAVCAGTDPELFFPVMGGSGDSAKALCRRCPVQAECLAYALRIGAQDGIFAGRSIRKQVRGDLELTLTCQYKPCGESFTSNLRRQKYCSKVCTRRAIRARYEERQRVAS